MNHHKIFNALASAAMAAVLVLSSAGCSTSGLSAGPAGDGNALAAVTGTSEAFDSSKAFDLSSDKKPTAEQLELASTQYYFWFGDDSSICINGFGQKTGADDIEVTPVKDILTDEVTGYTSYRKVYEKTGDCDYNVTMLSRLYDPDGNMVRDWTETMFMDSIGGKIRTMQYIDYIYSQETLEPQGRLTDPDTGSFIDNVDYIEKLDDSHALLIGTGQGDSYILDSRGDIIFDFSSGSEDTDKSYAVTSCGGYAIRADERDDECWDLSFYSSDGRLLGSVAASDTYYLDNSSISSPYVRVNGCIYDPSAGNGGQLSPLISAYDTVCFDGRLAVCVSMSDDGNEIYQLFDQVSGRNISGRYEKIIPVYADGQVTGNKEPDFFAGVRAGGIEKLDRSGNITATALFDGLNDIEAFGRNICVHYNDYDRSALIGPDLKLIISGDTYYSIYPLYDSDEDTDSDILTCNYFLDDEMMHYRTSLLTSDGKEIMTDTSYAGPVINGLIPVVRGRSIGLIDKNGSWLFRMPSHMFSIDD